MIDNDITDHLKNIAQELADGASAPGKNLKAVLLMGSVGRNMADAYSDIELMCIWSTAPAPQDRAAVFASFDTQELFPEEEENGEWFSVFLYKSVKVDICHIGLPLIEKTIDDVMAVRTTSIASQTLLAAIQDSVPLQGKDLFTDLTKRIAPYPEALAVRCIMVNASFAEWSMRSALRDRKDTVALHHLMDMSVLQMLRLLYALNRTYLRSYNFKWMELLSNLENTPEHLVERLNSALTTSDVVAATEDITALLHETLDLAEKVYPTLDLTQAKKTLNYTRQKMQP